MFPRRGRPRRVEKVKLVKFRESTFQLWNERKKYLGHNRLTNSEFAEILLHRGEHEAVVEEPASKRRRTELEWSQGKCYFVFIVNFFASCILMRKFLRLSKSNAFFRS